MSINLNGVSAEGRVMPVASWRPGYFVWPGGGTRLVILGGIGTRTGDAERSFSGLLHFLSSQAGYNLTRDVLEGTYAGVEEAAGWRPAPYVPADTRRPLIDAAEAFANCLDWYRDALPSDTRLCVVGYSLGGVVGLDGTTLAVARDRAGWQGRLGAVITLAAPLHGCSVGALVKFAWLVTSELDGLGAAGSDLDARWKDREEQVRLSRRAVFLRGHGARVLTLADPNDSVVQPEEALLPAPGESIADLQIAARVSRSGSLGHGGLLDDPATWRRVLSVVGPQSSDASVAVSDPIDQELKALKARLRSQGRIK